MNEDVMREVGRMMGEAMAMEQDFDLSTRETFPYGVAAYDRIARWRESERLEQEAILSQTVVEAGNMGTLLKRLRDLAELKDTKAAHQLADAAMLDFIGDPQVAGAFTSIYKWYA